MLLNGDEMSRLVFETHGEGQPVVFLHGLTFDRTVWRPVIDELGGQVRSIAVDLPGHGETSGPGCGLDELAASLADTLQTVCGTANPIVVGHSMAGILAVRYASSYPVAGMVCVDQSVMVGPFATIVRHAAPALRGERFETAFAGFERTIDMHLVPQPLRGQIMARRRINRDVVLAYWDEVIRTEPAHLQQLVEQQCASVTAPCLAVFGREIYCEERQLMTNALPQVQLEEWPGCGHLVHLVQPQRFAARLRAFVESCALLAR
jgi:pimeloyl-ACP methyl ester carboxylesterase